MREPIGCFGQRPSKSRRRPQGLQLRTVGDGTGTNGPWHRPRGHSARGEAASSIAAVAPPGHSGGGENSRSWQGPPDTYFGGPSPCQRQHVPPTVNLWCVSARAREARRRRRSACARVRAAAPTPQRPPPASARRILDGSGCACVEEGGIRDRRPICRADAGRSGQRAATLPGRCRRGRAAVSPRRRGSHRQRRARLRQRSSRRAP